MAGNQLTTGNNSGLQVNTQTPQSASQPSDTASSQSGGVQPGTANALLNGQGGVPLLGTQLSTVSLDTANQTAASSLAAPRAASNHHHVNPMLLSFPALLLVVGLVLFWTTSRGEKNKT